MFSPFRVYVDIGDWISALSGIGTFIAALVSLYTLRIVYLQRKDLIRPKVIFGDRVFANCQTREGSILKTEWLNLKDEPSFPGFKLMNAGYGIAEDVRLSSYWDIDAAIRFIKKRDISDDFEIERSDSGVTIRTKFDDSFVYVPILYGDKEARTLGSMLTMAQKSKPSEYAMDSTYLSLLTCVVYLINESSRIDEIKILPKMWYKISYKDMEGKEFKAYYEQEVFPVTTDSYNITMVHKPKPRNLPRI